MRPWKRVTTHSPAAGANSGTDACCAPDAINDVAVRASGGSTNIGMIVEASSASLRDVDITAVGGQEAVGVDLNGDADPFFRDSRITATGATNSTAARVGSAGGRFNFVDTILAASGVSQAYGLVDGYEEGASILSGGEVVVSSAGTAVGISNGSFDNFPNVTGTRINVVGGASGTGLSFRSPDGTATLDGVAIDASHIGCAIGGNGPTSLVLLRSTVSAGDAAVQTSSINEVTVQIDNSVLKAPLWIRHLNPEEGSISATRSVLDGSADYGGAALSCSAVFDRNYTLLPAGCPAP